MCYNRDMKKYCVYCHTNKINEKKYIGITSQKPERRWNNGEGYKNNVYFYRAIQKYGWHNFTHEILYTDLTKEDAENLEIKLIKEYETRFNEKGYNIESGGNVQKDVALETRRKISEKKTGFRHSEESKKKMSESRKGKESPLKGKKRPVEVIEKIRAVNIGREPWNKGRPWTDDERAKCGGKAVVCVELKKVYRTAHEAGKDLDLDFSSICKCVKGKAKTVGGYHWILAEEWEIPANE